MQDIQPLKNWSMIKDTPIAIAGPCSAETEEQLLATCRQIKENIDVSLLRAGIWKPRTRPGSFEGIGEEGLKWFKAVKEELNMPITTEVANAQHVELALKYGVDVLWIGARSTVNPFTIQEIADALKGVDVPVIVKNPINPDLALWMGAIERIYNSGIRNIAALHRGFSSHQKSKYRNEPMWSLAIALKSELPNLPILCDPSHIAGNRDLILPISQKAIDLDFDGLMIETHYDPTNAWSDAAQQVTPERLAEILNTIKIKQSSSDNPEFVHNLEDLRKQIDTIDTEILEALHHRMKVVDKIGEYKRDNNVTVFQADRWIDVFQNRPNQAQKLELNKTFVEQMFKLIHDESIRIQTKVVNTEKSEG
ncbi:chorismate mutase [Sediminitomix flava]|uniref:chorismate mutase n=1 Tax=Sediminitomix flava TaxID=379075 RepID=A0A315ZEL2_SEDFL|nr:chorismate mutase [Sediminitomix flava]PWJ43971.1 3-deoxy-D-arabinoheptulosonate-7-phosphate synthase [Sediminitomix flava]